MLNTFKLALLQMQREGKLIIDEKNEKLIYDKAEALDNMIKIKNWIEKHSVKTAEKIMQGEQVYNYNGKIKTYSKKG